MSNFTFFLKVPILLIQSLFMNSEVTWERYMGDFKEQSNIQEQDDLTLNNMGLSEFRKFNYDNTFSIYESTQKYGNPTLQELGSLLCFHCSEIEAIREKINIGYYAHSGPEANGYVSIDTEDCDHIEGLILGKKFSDTKIIDFILSSPGGLIEPSLELSKKLRHNFTELSFLLPGATYSAASALTFIGDEIIMQSNAFLGPINPRVNGFDTYIGKKIYNRVRLYSIFCPWALKHLPDAQIIQNKVTKKTLESLEEEVYMEMTSRLSKYLFKVHKLPFIQKLKTKEKIKSIVNFLVNFERHHTHVMPFLSDELISIGLPIKKADSLLDEQLRKIRNICKAITTTKWDQGGKSYYVRKIYFSSTAWYTLHYYPTQQKE